MEQRCHLTLVGTNADPMTHIPGQFSFANCHRLLPTFFPLGPRRQPGAGLQAGQVVLVVGEEGKVQSVTRSCQVTKAFLSPS